MPHLFDPLKIRDLTFMNRIFLSPMCQYSAEDGMANDWHFVHLGSRAVGGAALLLVESTAVTANGRINLHDLGLWDDRHIEPLARIVRFLDAQGSVAGVQLSHAGRKASLHRPWEGYYALPENEGGWTDVVAPSPVPFAECYVSPKELTLDSIQQIRKAYVAAAQRALAAGFRVMEIHAAHGYLVNEFLSPVSNQRADQYGGSFENRTRFLREIVADVRNIWPERLPVFVRISATDWVEEAWNIEQSVELARVLKPMGVDFIDCSSGGNIATAEIPVGAGYQTVFAERIRREAQIMTGAVGMITSAQQAEHIITTGQADAVLLGRELLRDPYWPMRAASELGQQVAWPPQYLRAASGKVPSRVPVAVENVNDTFAHHHGIPAK